MFDSVVIVVWCVIHTAFVVACVCGAKEPFSVCAAATLNQKSLRPDIRTSCKIDETLLCVCVCVCVSTEDSGDSTQEDRLHEPENACQQLSHKQTRSPDDTLAL